jgi:FMN phosphatase YigB (HAD superfamily)
MITAGRSAGGLAWRIARRALATSSRYSPLPARVLVRVDRRRGHGHDTQWDQLVTTILDCGARAVSVDIFDTVAIRLVVGADNVFWVVGARLCAAGVWADTVEEFVTRRAQAAAMVPEGSITDLYRTRPLVDRCDPSRGVDGEIDCELSLIDAVPGAPAALQRLRAAGVTIMFVTDMHLPPRTLWQVLTRNGLAVDGEQLIVSSEVGASKSSGALYEVVRDRERSSLHVGNDLWGDVAAAERAGVRSIAITSANPTWAEEMTAERVGGVGAAISGAARRARLQCRAKSPDDDGLFTLGADIAGQCLTAFLLWVRDECASDGIRDVAFVARDGELPLRMARAMPEDHWGGARFTYLEGNRTAWSLAAAAVLGVDEWLAGGGGEQGALHQQRHVIPLRALLWRVGLRPDDLPPGGLLAGLDPARPLPPRMALAFEALLEDPRTRDLIAERAGERRDLVVDHLRTTYLSAGRLALVDVGWTGRLAGLLTALIREATGVEPIHLHFGGSQVVGDPGAEIRRFAFDEASGHPPFEGVVSCVETFTQSGKARNVSFERDASGSVLPIYDDPVPDIDNPARRSVWDAAVETARRLPNRSTMTEWRLDPTPLDDEVRRILTALWTRPRRDDARAISELRFETDDAGHLVGPVAAPYRLREVLGLREPAPRQWRAGSLQLTPSPFREVMRLYFALRRRAHRN